MEAEAVEDEAEGRRHRGRDFEAGAALKLWAAGVRKRLK